MKISTFVIRVFRVLSLILFVLALFRTYLNLPGQVTVHYDALGTPDGFINKTQLFYGLAIFVVVLNVLLSVLALYVPAVPVRVWRMPHRDHWRVHKRLFVEIVTHWLFTLILLLNVFVTLSLLVLWWLNTNEKSSVQSFGWVLGLGVLLLLGWAVALPLRLSIKTTDPEEA